MEALLDAKHSILLLFDAFDAKIESANVDTLIAVAEAEKNLAAQLIRLEYAISKKADLEDILTTN